MVLGLLSKNSPRRRRLVPYTSSAVIQQMSSLRAVRILRRTKGSEFICWDEPSVRTLAVGGTLNHSICYRVVGSGMNAFDPWELSQLFPKCRFKLASVISGDC